MPFRFYASLDYVFAGEISRHCSADSKPQTKSLQVEFYSSQMACRANRNFLRPKSCQPARRAKSSNSAKENARLKESRASYRVIDSRQISAVKRYSTAND